MAQHLLAYADAVTCMCALLAVCGKDDQSLARPAANASVLQHYQVIGAAEKLIAYQQQQQQPPAPGSRHQQHAGDMSDLAGLAASGVLRELGMGTPVAGRLQNIVHDL